MNQNQNQNQNQTPPNDGQGEEAAAKKSFLVAIGELFLGMTTRFINRSSRGCDENPELFLAIERMKITSSKEYNERISKIIEDDIKSEVIWKQRVKDVEAKKERRLITCPDFSFSTADLLFPYHLGVSHFLIQNSNIEVFFYCSIVYTTLFSMQ